MEWFGNQINSLCFWSKNIFVTHTPRCFAHVLAEPYVGIFFGVSGPSEVLKLCLGISTWMMFTLPEQVNVNLPILEGSLAAAHGKFIEIAGSYYGQGIKKLYAAAFFMVLRKYFSFGILVLISRYIFIYTSRRAAPNYSFYLGLPPFSGNCFPFVLGPCQQKVFLFIFAY